jgi:large subunit ribosomal protein L10
LAISKQKKDELVAQYMDLIAQSDALILTEYKGMAVKDMQSLRSKIREADGAFYVTKNTLLKLALEESGTTVPDELLTGQVATGFALGEAPSLAKALVDYADHEDNLSIRGGVMHMEVLSAEQIESLAKLPTLDELHAQILGLISAPARDLVSIFASGMRQVVNVIDAYSKNEEAEAEVEAETA